MRADKKYKGKYKAGDLVIVTESTPYYKEGNQAKLIAWIPCMGQTAWKADFNQLENTRVKGDGIWYICEHQFILDESIALIEQEALASLNRVESPRGEDAVNEERLPIEPSFI